MNHWAGIKPKPLNQNKTSGVKPTQKNKMLKQHQSTTQKSLEEEVARAVQGLHQTSTPKYLEEEVAAAVQNLLALNNPDQSSGSDDNTTNLYNEKVSEPLIPVQGSSGQSNQDDSNLKTPENEREVIVDDMGRDKNIQPI